MLGGKIGPAVGGLIGAPIGMLGGLFGSRSKKREEARQRQMAANAAWSRHYDHLPLYDEMQKLRDDLNDLQRTISAARGVKAVAAGLAVGEFVIPRTDYDPSTGKPWHHVNFLRELNRTNQMDGTFPADRPAPSHPLLP